MEPSLRYLLPRAILTIVLLTILIAGCSNNGPTNGGFSVNPNSPLDWTHTIGPMLNAYCSACHSGPAPQSGFNATSYNSVISHVTANGNRVVLPGDPGASELLSRVKGQGFPRMPPGGNIGSDNIQAIEDWISNGAPENLSSGN